MKKFTLFAILAILIVLVAPFAEATDIPAVPSGIPLSELEQFIDEFAAERIGEKTAGASIAIIKDGQIVFNKAYGYAIQDETLVDTDSVFEWGSATKLLLWTSVMQLAEQGKIDLNKDIREYLPENFLKKLRYETPVTMYNLMHHNAGWEDRNVDLFYNSPNSVPGLEESLLAWEPAQVFPPGTVVAYSNFGTAIAGFIVERVSGLYFYQYVWENIFEPLEMKDTSIHPIQADNPSIAERREQIKGHIPEKDKLVPAKNERAFIGMYPAGSVIGTALDATKFLSALMPGNETSALFIDNKTLDEMLSVSLYFRDGFPRYSHGFMEHFGAVRALGHGGNTVAFSALFTFAPLERFGVVVMTNQAGETALCAGLTKALFGEYVLPERSSEFADANELAGMFTMARRQMRGFIKIFNSSAFLPVKAIDENTLNIAGAIFIQVSPYVFKNTGGLEMLDILDYIFFETDGSSVSRISAIYFDVLPVSTGNMIISFGSMILLVLCLLYIPAALVISIIGAVKNRKRGIPSNLMKKLNIALFASMAAVFFNNIILAVKVMNFETYSSLQVHFVFNIVYAVLAPICVGFMLVNWKKESAKASMVFNMFTIVSSIVLAVILITWEFWR